MRKLLVAWAGVVMCGGMTGCGYKTTVNTVSGINVYSSYEEKIPGRFALVVDSQPELLTKKVKASSFTCSAHNFPVALSNTFESSIYEATKSIFEEVATRVTIPSKEEMSKDELSGYILVKATHFEPKVTFIPGFFSGNVSTSADIGFEFSVRDRENKLILSSAVSASRSSDGEAGGACEGGATSLSEAISKAFREALERYAERVSNSTKLREAFAPPLLKQADVPQAARIIKK